MSALPDPTWSPVDEDAARWVLRNAQDRLPPGGRAEFEAWYAADPLHARTYDALAASWRRLGQLKVLPVARKRGKPGFKALLGACVMVAASLLAWQAWQQHGTISSGIALTRLTLPDGSLAILDAHTRVRLHFEKGQRHVQLEAGRAFFLVVPSNDKTGPFTVVAGPAQATALGTQYEVSLNGQLSRVAVYEHTVRVQCHVCDTAQAVILQPGERATVTGRRLQTLSSPPGEADTAPAWTRGLLSVDDMSVHELARQLGQYTKRLIWVVNERAGSTRVSGVVRAAQPAAALSLLLAGSDVSIRELPGVIVIY